MEDSIDSIRDNGDDKDTPLKQVVQLCSILAGKGSQFSISVRIKDSFVFSLKSEKPDPSQGKRRSPSYARRQLRRKLLKKKKTDSLPEVPEEPKTNNCSLDLNPCPDRGLLGYKEISEQESSADDTGSESGSNASGEPVSETKQEEGGRDVSTEDPTNQWERVSNRRRRSSPVLPTRSRQMPSKFGTPLRSDCKHIVDTTSFKNGAYKKKIVTVFAPKNISRETLLKAMHPSFDSRYLRFTSFKGDKIVYYPACDHKDECVCSECNE